MLRFVGFVCLFCLLWRVAWLSWLPVGLVWCVCGWLIGCCILCLVLSGCLWFSCGCVGDVLSFGLLCCWVWDCWWRFWWTWFSLSGFLACLGVV